MSTVPSATAVGSATARCMRNGISMFSPPRTEATASRTPKVKSDVTNPSQPHSSRRIDRRRVAFSPHHSPFTRL